VHSHVGRITNQVAFKYSSSCLQDHCWPNSITTYILAMKRSRSTSHSPTPSWSSVSSTEAHDTPRNSEFPPSAHRSHKHVRVPQEASSSAEPLIRCTIGPICSASPQTFPTQKALQSHYIKAHSFVCKGLVSRDRISQGIRVGASPPDALGDGRGIGEMEECGKIFPEERLLELVSRRLLVTNPLSTNAIELSKADRNFRRRLHLAETLSLPPSPQRLDILPPRSISSRTMTR
jgi:hypothetical protein